MSHVHIAAISKALEAKLIRTCPSCRKQQKVQKEHLREAVACHHCGASIPPRPESK